jgi:hypothetical protein
LALWQQALSPFQTAGDVRRIAYCLLRQGEAVLAQRNHLPQAESHLRQAAHNYQLLHHPRGRVRSLELLEDCLRQQQKLPAAERVHAELETARKELKPDRGNTPPQ